MQKIIPHLWFDKEAVEATTFYTSIFPNSSVKNVNKIKDTLSGDCDIVTFNILGLDMMAISAGPYFKPSSAISFMINFDPSTDTDARGNLDRIWNQLIVGGKIMMPLDKYPFSEHYGWVEDRYGYSWQLILTNPNGEPRPSIMPSLLFVKDNFGKAKEATDYY